MVSRTESFALSDRNAQVELRMSACFLHYPRLPLSSLLSLSSHNRHATLRLAAQIDAAGYTTSKADHVT